MTLGKFIRLKRNELGYSQENMAHMLNIAKNTYGRMENDKEIRNKDERKEKIAEIFGLSVEELQKYSERGSVFYDEVKCETGGYIGSNFFINNSKLTSQLEEEIEKLKKENATHEQYIENLKAFNSHLEKRVSDLEAIICLMSDMSAPK